MSPIAAEETTRLIRERIRRLASEKIAPLANRIDMDDEFPTDCLASLAETGSFGALLSERYGLGRDMRTFALITETLAEASAAVAWIFVAHATSSAIAEEFLHESEKKQAILHSLASGKKLIGYAFTEPGAGAAIAETRSVSTPIDGGFALSGSKNFISLARTADFFIVSSKVGDGEAKSHLNMLLVERGMTGFKVGSSFRGLGLRGIAWGELILDGCRVPSENLLGAPGGGFEIVKSIAKTTDIGAAAISLGVAEAAYKLTVRHARERTVGDKPLGNHESVQSKIAEMAARVEASRALVYRACAEEGDQFLHQEAKLFTSEAAVETCEDAIQLQGAHGYSTLMPTERYLRDAIAVTLHFHNNGLLRTSLGRLLTSG